MIGNWVRNPAGSMKSATLVALLIAGTLAAPTHAQTGRSSFGPDPEDHTRSRFSFGFGYGPTDSQLLTDYLGEMELKGVSMTVRVLVRTPWLGSRLRLGGEWGMFTVEPGGRGTSGCINCIEPDDAGHHLNLLADVNVISTPRVAVHPEVGLGLVLYAVPEYAAFEGTPRPGTEMMASLRLVAAVRVSSGITIDPYVETVRAFGSTEALYYGAGLGMSIYWD